uniref:Uncharacterized protein n=2 Tax=Panagrolaimus sp. JU765 TaxID=591449 RepID=A0AC34QP40_9BILA
MREFEMFRKPKGRNIRQRQREENTEDEEKSPVKPAEKAQNDVKSEDDDDFPKANAKKPVQLFSFDQDEGNDTEEFKVKKPSQKKRAERLMKKAKEYEKRQKELEAASKNEAVKDLELIVRNPITIRSRSEESDVEVLEDDEVVIEAVHHEMEVKSSFGTVEGIPDAKTVYEMKKKREQMRRDGGKINDDSSFIPLSTEKVVRSRLVREDDNDLSDEDGENVSEFYSSKSLLVTEEERRKREQEEFLRIEGDSEEEEEESDTEAKRKAKESDDEFAEWEKHQIQKAVSSRKVRQIQRETLAVTNEQQITPETVDLADLEEDMDIEVIETLPVIKNLPDVSQMKLADITGKIKL